jgi:hypothetical protein
LTQKKHITASCIISDQVVYKDTQPVYENKGLRLPEFLESVYQHFQLAYPKFYKMDRLCQLGFLACEILLEGNFKRDRYRPDEVAVVLANSNASLDTDLRYSETMKTIASPALFVYTLPNIMIGEICIRNGFKGENAFFVFKQFDATFIEQYVSYLLDGEMAESCICGWVELLREEYRAFLMLVEKGDFPASLLFTGKNITKMDASDHG